MAETFNQALAEKLDTLKTLLLERHREYGPDNILRAGIPGIFLREGDVLVKQERSFKQGNFPRFRDHCLDLAGYALICLLLVDQEFSLPLEKEEPFSQKAL